MVICMFFIIMLVPPKIMPFQFTNHLLREGMRAAISCTVLEGDRPIDLVWEFEGKTITAANSQVCKAYKRGNKHTE